ncbi:MAG: VOC family protein [bacterium]|nr:VOC family protein [bacterium]
MLKKLDSLLFYVSNVNKTAEFYKELGFEQRTTKKGMAVLNLSEFSLHFRDKNEENKLEFRAEATAEPKGVGLYIYIEVGDIDNYYKGLLDKGLKPSSKPRDWPWGNREFVIRDPDSYKLVFYQPIKN